MSSTGVDRITGIDPNVAIKAPCKVIATTNITLLGSQTIDGVAVAETTPKTRVVVNGQTSSVNNGIYDVYDTAWVRSTDFNGSRDVVDSTFVSVDSGTLYGDTIWRIQATNPVIIGTSAITFIINSNFSNGIQVGTTFAALAFTPASVDRIINIARHTSGTIGGGQFIGVSGSVTDDGGTQVNSSTAGFYWKRTNLYELDPYMFGATGVAGADTTAIATALGVLKTNGRGGKLIIPATINKAATVPALALSNSYAVQIIDYRVDVPGQFGQEVHYIEGRDASGGYAGELKVKSKQQPSLSLQSLSDGTVFGYRAGIPNNMTGVNMFKANGDSIFQWLSDPLAAGVIGDMGVIQYAAGNSSPQFAEYYGVDGNNKTRIDVAPAQFTQTTLAITAVSNTTPIVITLAANHNIIPTRTYVTLSGTGFATVDGPWRCIVSAVNQLTLINSIAAGVGVTGSCILQVNVQRASLNAPKTQGGTEAICSEGVCVATGTSGYFSSEVATGVAPFQALSTTPDVKLHAKPLVFNVSGNQQVGAHIHRGIITLVAGTYAHVIPASAVFTNAGTYSVSTSNQTAARAVQVIQTDGANVTFNGTGTDVISFTMTGS